MPKNTDILIPKTLPVSDLLADVKPIQWLINDVLDRGTLAAIVAQPSRFKSFVALDMACSVATGTDWMNYPTTQGPVVYLCGEGKRGLLDRIRAWFDHKGLEPNDAPLLITQGGFAAQESQNVDRYISAVTEALLAAPQVKQSPALIIIDTYSRYAAGLDENSASETAVMVAQLNRLQELFGATVMIVHHVSKGTGDARGSTAFGGALDWQYKVLREGDGDSHSKAIDLQDLRATVVLTKCKDHQGPLPVHIKGTIKTGVHSGTANVPYSSLVFGLNDGLEDDIYTGLASQGQHVFNAYLVLAAKDPNVTLLDLETASNKTNVSRILQQITAWLKHRLSVREIHYDSPSSNGLSALRDLLEIFKLRDLPEAQPRGKASLQTLITDTEI